MSYPELKTFERPMQRLIDAARELGYDFTPELKKWDHCLRIKEWMQYKYNIYTWVIPHSNFTFTPYYKDLRNPTTRPKKFAFSEYYNQAFIEGLLYALDEIK